MDFKVGDFIKTGDDVVVEITKINNGLYTLLHSKNAKYLDGSPMGIELSGSIVNPKNHKPGYRYWYLQKDSSWVRVEKPNSIIRYFA